jgi:L-lactate dehydrogenase complex protein LldF
MSSSRRIEKVVPTLEDASQILRVLARSATGQELQVYTTFSTGPKRDDDPDGPEEYHVILLDNGRSAMLGTEFEDMLRCIRCGACMNHCPVYRRGRRPRLWLGLSRSDGRRC